MIKIPDKALEAGARTITLALMHVVDEDSALPLTDNERAELARTACLAMLEAWPGAYTANQVQAERPPVLCLPLPQEARYD